MDDITVVPVYQLANALRKEIASQLEDASQALRSDDFEAAAHLLSETSRLVRVLQTITEE